MAPSRNIHILAAFGLALLLVSAGCETRDSLTRSRIKKVERGLLRAAYIKGTAPEKLTLSDRMAFYRVPGAGIAVIDGYGLEWAKGYGVKDLQTNAPVTTDTLFQAGSLMRPLVSALLLSLAEKGKLDSRPPQGGKDPSLWPLWVRSAGLAGPASPGLPRKEALPGLATLAAADPGWDPTGAKAGLVAVQQMLLNKAGAPLPALMDASVFLPLSMTRSVCEVPLPADAEARAALGHLRGGGMVEGGWMNYPVSAADGLWTTPTDYAAFLNGVVGDAMGKSALALSPESARTLLTPPAARGSLGFVFEGMGNDHFFRAQSRTAGYTAVACYFPALGRGAVVMTNSENGGLLGEEILRAIAAAYQWPHFAPAEKTLFRLDPSIIAEYVGDYEVTPDYSLHVTAEDYYLLIEPTGQARTKFYVENETIFFSIDPFIRIQFRRDEARKVNGLVLWQEDFEQKAVKVR